MRRATLDQAEPPQGLDRFRAMRRIRIVLVPYHAGKRDERVGRGPQRLMEDGIADQLAQCGYAVDVNAIQPVDEFEGEIGKSFELIRRVATGVAEARRDGCLPVVLAGNCNTSVGVHAGVGDDAAGVIWFDAHPDFDTPEEHRSGYFDGMGAATLVGDCWKNMAATVTGFRPLPTDRLLFCGIRDFEEGQLERVRAAGIAAIVGSLERSTDYVAQLERELQGLRFDRALVHIDVDCLDTSVGRANEYAVPGGLTADQLSRSMRALRGRVEPAAVTIASFNPDLEGSGGISQAARGVLVELLR